VVSESVDLASLRMARGAAELPESEAVELDGRSVMVSVG